MVSQEQIQQQANKLKLIDKFAKDLGFTIYRIDCDFELDGEVNTLSFSALNEFSEKYKEFLDISK